MHVKGLCTHQNPANELQFSQKHTSLQPVKWASQAKWNAYLTAMRNCYLLVRLCNG